MAIQTRTATTYTCDSCGLLVILDGAGMFPEHIPTPPDWVQIRTLGHAYIGTYCSVSCATKPRESN